MAQMIFRSRPGENNFLTRLNPLTKLLGLILFSFGLTSGLFEVTIAFMAVLFLIAFSLKVPVRDYIKASPALSVIAGFIFITEWTVSKSIHSAIYETLKFTSLILTSCILLDTTDPYDLSSSLGRLLSPVFGKYAWRFSSYVMLTLALLPMIFNASSTMMDARRSRLGSFFSHPVKNISEYMLSLMLNIIAAAETYSDALESRLYDEDAERLSPIHHACDILISSLLILGIIWINAL